MRAVHLSLCGIFVLVLAGGVLTGCPTPTAPVITANPLTQTVAVGDSASFTVAATSSLPLLYQWQMGGADIAGATSPTMTISSVQLSDAGSYMCVVTNAAGSVNSDAATLTVNNPTPAEPTITTQPASQTVSMGAAASFSVTATGAAPITYQWQLNGANVADATSASYTIASVAMANAGTYTCMVANAGGSVPSDPATLTVVQAPAITTQPVSQTIGLNDPATLTVAATGTAPLTYQWQQNGTNISGAASPSYAITVAAAANSGSYTCVVSNAAGKATSNAAALMVFDIRVVAKNANDITAQALTTQPSSGLTNIAIGTDIYLMAEPANATATYAWSVPTKPSGSNAAFLSTVGNQATFEPDLEGTYVVQVSQTTGAKSSVTVGITIHAGTWVGAGAVAKDGSGITVNEECSFCHTAPNHPGPDEFTPWLKTEHATMFARGIDGEVSSHYGASCAQCHTVGYNTAPTAVNDGFDDIAKQLNWVFPTPLQEGNWASMVTNYPDLAQRANIQCENCHGPASGHRGSAFTNDPKMDDSLDPGVCGQCHYGSHPQLDQWQISSHADGTAQAFIHPAGNTTCTRCHTGGGYIDFINGVPTAQQRTNFQVITCAVCHDPHDATNDYQLRASTVTLPGDSAARTGIGPSATCMNCHNGRVTPDSATAAKPSFPHHSTASEVLLGKNGITFGNNLSSSPHQSMAQCVDCHMAASPTSGTGKNEVGGHTFQLRYVNASSPDNGFQNVQNACNVAGCHGASPLTDLNRPAKGDYDGNGQVQGVQDEVKGLLALVLQQLQANGVAVGSGSSPWTFTQVPAAKLTVCEQAAWNYTLISSDGSFGIHNTEYTVGLLQLTYKQLAGKDVPNAMIRY